MNPSKTEVAKAQAWREGHNWTAAELGELIGYSREAIYLLERGVTSRLKPVPSWTWLRYKMACAGLQHQLDSKKEFQW